MSSDNESVVRLVSTKEFKFEFEDVRGLVLLVYSSLELQLGCVTSGNKE